MDSRRVEVAAALKVIAAELTTIADNMLASHATSTQSPALGSAANSG